MVLSAYYFVQAKNLCDHITASWCALCEMGFEDVFAVVTGPAEFALERSKLIDG